MHLSGHDHDAAVQRALRVLIEPPVPPADQPAASTELVGTLVELARQALVDAVRDDHGTDAVVDARGVLGTLAAHALAEHDGSLSNLTALENAIASRAPDLIDRLADLGPRRAPWPERLAAGRILAVLGDGGRQVMTALVALGRC